MSKSQLIVPCLWFDTQAEEAANLYTSLFANSSIGKKLYYGEEGQDITEKQPGAVMTVNFDLSGYSITALNGGPQFKITPAISFFVTCASEAELDKIWAGLIEGGFALMALDKYPWSEKFGWVQDRFGVNWQLMMGKFANPAQQIAPCLMYVGAQAGKAEEAINLYIQTIPGSKVHFMDRYKAGEGDSEGTIKHAQFELAQQMFVAMDSGLGHAFSFNEGFSLQIMCENQAEIDAYWEKLTADGGEAGPCGWLKDKFGVSWQVTPTVLYDMLHDPDTVKSQRAIKAMFQMSKFDIATLQKAYDG